MHRRHLGRGVRGAQRRALGRLRPRLVQPVVLVLARRARARRAAAGGVVVRAAVLVAVVASALDPVAVRGGGGALVIEDMGGESAIKLGPGDAVIYPTGALHRVAPVTGGERLAVVGWIRSLVRRADQREILFDLELTSRAVFEKDGKSAIFDTLSKTRSNLLRMWAED